MRVIEIDAKDHYEAGYLLGRMTARIQQEYIRALPRSEPWEKLIRLSKPYLSATKRIFPQYIDEINGLANGAGLPFEKIWVFHCMDEILRKGFVEKCSSVFMRKKNGEGYVVGHNEDWDSWTKKYYFMLKRTIGGKVVLELGLAGVMSAATVSVNSYGLVQAINSLYHADFQVGIPKQIVARWLADRESLLEAKQEFPKLHRAAGYCYNLCQNTRIFSIESSAKRFEFYETQENYAHTNHYIGILKEVEEEKVKDMPSLSRYNSIRDRLKGEGTAKYLQNLLLYSTEDSSSIFRKTDTATVASVIFDIPGKKCYVTQENKGTDTLWQQINLDFIS